MRLGKLSSEPGCVEGGAEVLLLWIFGSRFLPFGVEPPRGGEALSDVDLGISVHL